MRLKPAFVLFVMVLFAPQIFAATLDQLLPWLAPNALAFGTPFPELATARPLAKETFPADRRPGEPFNGVMSERFGDGSLMLYSFENNELAAINWGSGRVPKMTERLSSVRNALIRIHGQPVMEYAARVDRGGSIAKIVREVYRPTIDKDCIMHLVTTSEGIEVNVTDEAVYKRHGRTTARESYEEAVRSVSAVVQPNEKPSELVDYLAAERKKAETPQPDATPKPPIPESPSPKTPVPPATPLPSATVAKVPESPASPVERAPVWPWVIGTAALIAILALVFKRRA